MKQEELNYLYDCFQALMQEHGLQKVNEINEMQTYSIEFRSDKFGLKLEKYRNEFYPTLYKNDFPDREINLFNLLDYLNKEFSDFKYSKKEIRGEKELETYYEEQLKLISTTIAENFTAINEFFSSKDYELKLADLRRYMLEKYPMLFKHS